MDHSFPTEAIKRSLQQANDFLYEHPAMARLIPYSCKWQRDIRLIMWKTWIRPWTGGNTHFKRHWALSLQQMLSAMRNPMGYRNIARHQDSVICTGCLDIIFRFLACTRVILKKSLSDVYTEIKRTLMESPGTCLWAHGMGFRYRG